MSRGEVSLFTLMKRLFDILWLLILAAYVFATPPTFHGDEAMQIAMSRDFITAFVDGNPRALTTAPPYLPDTDPQLRLINGSVNRYAIGLIWRIAGDTANDLPTGPGWQWELDLDANAARGNLPDAAQLAVARLPSTLFLALSVAVMFALGWHFGGRIPAYLASALYALNPVILLNGRRAMQEGAMFFFGLLTLLIAIHLAKRIASSKTPPYLAPASSQNPQKIWAGRLPALKSGRGWGWGSLLILAAALTLASKHTGIVFVVAAFGWIGITALVQLNGRIILQTGLRLAAATLLTLALFVAFSPALWNDPLARLGDLLAVRAELLEGQVDVEPGAPLTITQRLTATLTQPFMTPTQHYEAAFWGSFPAITDDVERYNASPFSGVQFGLILGGALTLMAGVGTLVALLRSRSDPQLYGGVLLWLIVSAATSLANPLPWQRYYLPLIPPMTLLSVIGLDTLIRRIVRKSEQPSGFTDMSSHGLRQTD